MLALEGRPVVGDRHDAVLPIGAHVDGDGATAAVVLDRVADEVGDHLPSSARVAEHLRGAVAQPAVHGHATTSPGRSTIR
jgi:hypothetical protein